MLIKQSKEKKEKKAIGCICLIIRKYRKLEEKNNSTKSKVLYIDPIIFFLALCVTMYDYDEVLPNLFTSRLDSNCVLLEIDNEHGQASKERENDAMKLYFYSSNK
jgi:hypothetical protein